MSKIENEIMEEITSVNETQPVQESKKIQKAIFVNHSNIKELNQLLATGWKVINTCQMYIGGSYDSSENGVFFTIEGVE